MNGSTVFIALLSWAIPTEMKRIRKTKGVNAVYVILMVMLVLLVIYLIFCIMITAQALFNVQFKGMPE